MPDLSLINSLCMELHMTAGELLAGKEHDEEEKETSQQMTDLVNYAAQEKLNLVRRWKRILTIILIVMLFMLIDLSIGYFSTSMHWIIKGREFQSYGLIFGLIFGGEKVGNFEGNFLSKMFGIYLFFVVWLILMLIAVLVLSLTENRLVNQRQKH